MTPCSVCGSTNDVRRYLVGHRCPLHTPAAQAGHPEPPDPAASVPASSPEPPPREYGTATTDPRGPMIYASGGGRYVGRYGIASYPCPAGCGRPKGHKDPCPK